LIAKNINFKHYIKFFFPQAQFCFMFHIPDKGSSTKRGQLVAATVDISGNNSCREITLNKYIYFTV
jgi:hypothetical protein